MYLISLLKMSAVLMARHQLKNVSVAVEIQNNRIVVAVKEVSGIPKAEINIVVTPRTVLVIDPAKGLTLDRSVYADHVKHLIEEEMASCFQQITRISLLCLERDQIVA